MIFSKLFEFENKSFRNNRYNFTTVTFVILLYKFLLDYIYKYLISPLFSYTTLTYDFNSLKYLSSIIVITLFSFFIKYFLNNFKPSHIIILCFYILYFIPFNSIYALANLSTNFYIYGIIFFLLISIYSIFLDKFKIKLKLPKNSKNIFLLITCVIVFLILFLIIFYNGLGVGVSFSEIYDVRLAVREMNVSSLYGYLKSFGSKLVLILLLVSLIKKNLSYVLIFTYIQLMIFSFGALKSDLFNLVIVYLIYFFYNDKYRKWIIYGLVLLNVFAILEYLFFDTIIISSIFQRRVLFIPPRLSFQYYDFFSQNELLYLRDSFLRFFGYVSPYSEKASYLLGYIIDGDPNSNANTGLCGDDFSQFGWMSLLIYPFLMAFIFKLYDLVSRGIDYRIVLYISITYALSFISGSFFMILITNGFLLILIYLYFYPRFCKILN